MPTLAVLRSQIADLLEATVRSLQEAERRLSAENEVRYELRTAQERLVEAEAASLDGPAAGGDEVQHLMSCLRWIVAVAEDLDLGIKEAALRRTVDIARRLRDIADFPDRSGPTLTSLESVRKQRLMLLQREPRLAMRAALR